MADIKGNSLRASSVGLGVFGGKAGAAVKNKAAADRALSKCLEINSNYRIFFKTITLDDGSIDFFSVLGAGRSLDFEIFNSSFLSYTADMYTFDEVTGEIHDLTALQDWSKIGRVIYEAQCTREKKRAEHEAEDMATSMGKPIDQVSLNRKLEAIELEFHGGEAADGTKISPKKNVPLSGIQIKMITRVLVVRMMPDGRPDFKNAQYASLDVSRTKLDQLEAVLGDAQYVNPADGYLEVQYNYIGADKAAAGRSAQFQGVADSLRLNKMFPQEWEAKGKSLVDNLIPGTNYNEMGDLVLAKNMNFRRRLSANDIPTLFSKWAQENAVVYTSIDYESKYTIDAAPYFLKYGLLNDYDKIKEEFEKIVVDVPAEEHKASDMLGSHVQSEEANSLVDAAKAIEPTPVVPTAPVQESAPTVTPTVEMPSAPKTDMPFTDTAKTKDALAQPYGPAKNGVGLDITADDDELGDLD